LAILVLRFDIASFATVGVLIGAMFLGTALNEFMASTMVGGGWRFVHLALGPQGRVHGPVPGHHRDRPVVPPAFPGVRRHLT
jgi:hypothetical protein